MLCLFLLLKLILFPNTRSLKDFPVTWLTATHQHQPRPKPLLYARYSIIAILSTLPTHWRTGSGKKLKSFHINEYNYWAKLHYTIISDTNTITITNWNWSLYKFSTRFYFALSLSQQLYNLKIYLKYSTIVATIWNLLFKRTSSKEMKKYLKSASVCRVSIDNSPNKDHIIEGCNYPKCLLRCNSTFKC